MSKYLDFSSLHTGTAGYSWDYCGFGGTLTNEWNGKSVWLQGDDADQFDDEWESCEGDEAQSVLASAYDDIME